MEVLSSKMITRMMSEHGIKGYGIYRFIQDCIEQDYDKLCKQDDLKTLAYAIRCDLTAIEDIVYHYGLFLIDEDNNISNISYLE